MAGGDDLATRLEKLKPPTRPRDTSAVRQRIRETFEAIQTARTKGVTWAQIAEVLAADGAVTSDGTPPTDHEVRALFHLERYARGEKRQRRRPRSERSTTKAEGKVAAPASTAPEPPPAPKRPAPAALPDLEEDEPAQAAPAAPLFRPASLKGKGNP